MTTLMSSKMDPYLPLGQPTTIHIIRVIGPTTHGASPIKLVCKRDLHAAAVSAYDGKQGHYMQSCTANDVSKNGIIPITFLPNIAVVQPSAYDNSLPSSLDTYHQFENSPQHSLLSTESSSLCDDHSTDHFVSNTPSPDISIDNVPDDPINELMSLEFPDFDCSDLLGDEDLWDVTSFDYLSKPQSPNTQTGEDGSFHGCARSDRLAKKRSSNRQAALRYRERKRLKKQGFISKLDSVRSENERLRAELLAEYQSAALLIDLARGML